MQSSSYVGDSWNYTGDAYVQDADGCLRYQSRTDDMIISAGYNIAAVEVRTRWATPPSPNARRHHRLTLQAFVWQHAPAAGAGS